MCWYTWQDWEWVSRVVLPVIMDVSDLSSPVSSVKLYVFELHCFEYPTCSSLSSFQLLRVNNLVAFSSDYASRVSSLVLRHPLLTFADRFISDAVLQRLFGRLHRHGALCYAAPPPPERDAAVRPGILISDLIIYDPGTVSTSTGRTR